MTESERFEEIYREYHDKVLSYLRSRVNSAEDAEDLCSEVFRKALENWDARSGVSSYLYTISHNVVIDYYRTRRVHSEIPEDLPAEGNLEETLLSSDALDRLAGALRQLPEQERDIIVLHYYANNTLHEIADKMQLPYSVLKRRHQAALKKLRELLGEI